MDKKGKLSNKLIKAGGLWKEHFDQETMDFLHEQKDTSMKKRILSWPQNTQGIFSDALVAKQDAARRNSDDPSWKDYMAQVRHAGDLMNQITALDPAKRLDAEAALRHPFCLHRKEHGKEHHQSSTTSGNQSKSHRHHGHHASTHHGHRKK